MFALLMMKPYLYFSELIYIQEISVLLNTIQLDLGITNTSMFNSRSWLILFTVISQPSFDHRLTVAIHLTASIQVN